MRAGLVVIFAAAGWLFVTDHSGLDGLLGPSHSGLGQRARGSPIYTDAIGDEQHSGATHYDILAVSPSATQAQIRDAYRAAARLAHPDAGGTSPRSSSPSSTGSSSRLPTMVDLNEAYRVLGDPTRRAAYDARLRNPSVTPPTPTTAPGPHAELPNSRGWLARLLSPPGPARYPIRPVLIAALVSTLALLLLSSRQLRSGGDGPAGGIDGVIEPGSCITVDAQLNAIETPCGPDELVVDSLVAVDRSCPAGQQGYRDRGGMATACVIEP